MRPAGIRSNWRRTLLAIALIFVAAFTVFELGVRLLTPDAMQYEIQTSTNGGPITTQSGTITNAATIARWRAAVTANPSDKLVTDTLLREWRKEDTCAPLSVTTVSYVFLWHGQPLESVSTLSSCTGESMISSGGLPDPHTYLVVDLIQP